MKTRAALATVLLAALALLVWARPAPPAAGSAVALEERLARLSRWGTIVYVTAHPDDESAGIITYLARGLHTRVVILCLTRGGGGQNQVGPELGEDLARVRTEELERAAAGYGAEVRFLGAEDFGYSKSIPETLAHWKEEAVVGELVRQIRALRPLAVISHWSGTSRDGGNAHHLVAGLFTRQAFALAGEPSAYPAQILRGLKPWQPRYLLIRSYSAERGDFPVPVRDSAPVAGKTYEELAWEAFQNHRSQGLHRRSLSDLRNFIREYYLRVEATLRDGPPPPTHVAELAPDLASLPQLFPSVQLPAGWLEGMVEAVELADRAREQFHADRPAEAAAALVEGAALLDELRREIPPGGPGSEAASLQLLLADRQAEFLRAAAELAGVRLEALTDRAVFTPGEGVWVGLDLTVGRPGVFDRAGFAVQRLQLAAPEDWTVEPVLEGSPPGLHTEYVTHIAEAADPAHAPFPALRGMALLTTGSLQVEISEPVRGLTGEEIERRSLWERLDPRRLFGATEAETRTNPVLEPVSLAPAVTLEVQPELRLLRSSPGETTYDVWVRVWSHRPDSEKISVWLDVPTGWYTPAPQQLELNTVGAATVRFSLKLPGRVPRGSYEIHARARRGRQTFSLARRRWLAASSAPPYRFVPATARLQVLDLDVPPGLRVGYIGFNHDPVPALLAQLGVTVDMLDARALAARPLAPYDALLIATRAYDYRDDLAKQQTRLLDYVRQGGTLIVELQGRSWDPKAFAPYPAEKPGNRNLRVTDPTAPVRPLQPEHPVLNFPNRIDANDWEGWVQERGLYFWQSWSPHYTPLIELADPGEEPLRGSLLYARHGQGAYIYYGLVLFRQVRAGVPGGVRLYLNLLSQGRALKPGD